jgi:hypothetical protein
VRAIPDPSEGAERPGILLMSSFEFGELAHEGRGDHRSHFEPVLRITRDPEESSGREPLTGAVDASSREPAAVDRFLGEVWVNERV